MFHKIKIIEKGLYWWKISKFWFKIAENHAIFTKFKAKLTFIPSTWKKISEHILQGRLTKISPDPFQDMPYMLIESLLQYLTR